MSENGEIYTAGKNFTLLPAVTAQTNSTSDTEYGIGDGDGNVGDNGDDDKGDNDHGDMIIAPLDTAASSRDSVSITLFFVMYWIV